MPSYTRTALEPIRPSGVYPKRCNSRANASSLPESSNPKVSSTARSKRLSRLQPSSAHVKVTFSRHARRRGRFHSAVSDFSPLQERSWDAVQLGLSLLVGSGQPTPKPLSFNACFQRLPRTCPSLPCSKSALSVHVMLLLVAIVLDIKD
jgi:hypothetical protein